MPGKFVHRLPADINLVAACLCEPLAVAIKGMKRLRRTWRQKEKKNSKSCAVVGAGLLGESGCGLGLHQEFFAHQLTPPTEIPPHLMVGRPKPTGTRCPSLPHQPEPLRAGASGARAS